MDQRWCNVLLKRALMIWAAAYSCGPMPAGVAVAASAPTCSHPASVEGHFDALTPDLYVHVKADLDPSAIARMLADKYHFTVWAIWAHAPHGFLIKDIDVALIPLLQCEPTIETLAFDVVTTIT